MKELLTKTTKSKIYVISVAGIDFLGVRSTREKAESYVTILVEVEGWDREDLVIFSTTMY